MTLKKSIILSLAGAAILLVGFLVQKEYEQEQAQSLATTYIGIRLAQANLTFSDTTRKSLRIHCDKTPSSYQSLPTILPCSNLNSTETPKVLIGTTRFQMDHPKTREQLARIVLEIYENKKTSSSSIVTCVTDTVCHID